MTGFIDTHAHIYLKDFDDDINEIIGRSRNVGVEKILMPNIDSSTIQRMMSLVDAHPDYCLPMMGLHPCSVKEGFEKELEIVEEKLNNGSFCAVGEMGTDLYWDKTFWNQQKEAFVFQLKLSKRLGLPMVIHCRESLDQTIKLIEDNYTSDLSGVFHCFSGTVEQGKKIAELGFNIGIGGVSTFKNGGLDRVLPELGLINVILETDSPYLAPVPHRGKRNEPSYIPIIAETISRICNVSIEEVRQVTTQNAVDLFNL